MRLLSYIQSLLGHFKKSTVLDDLVNTMNEFKDVIVPVYREMAKVKDSKFTSAAALELNKIYDRNVKGLPGTRGKNLLEDIFLHLDEIQVNMGYVEKQLEITLEEDVIREGLTAKKAILIRAAEQLSYLSSYLVDLLDYIVVLELGVDPEESFLKVKITKIEGDFLDFCRIIAIFGQENSKFIKALETVPEVNVNEQTAGALGAVYDDSQLDPFDSPFAKNFRYNPFYHIGLIAASWQAERYAMMREKRRMLELRVLQLELSNKKTPDPAVEKEIEYIKGRIETYEYKMAKMER